jgi:hypothetical protein
MSHIFVFVNGYGVKLAMNIVFWVKTVVLTLVTYSYYRIERELILKQM